jgi:rubredoxin
MMGPSGTGMLFNCAHIEEMWPYNVGMLRALVWTDQPRFRGWGCSHCSWVFRSEGPPAGDDLAEMVRTFETHRDEEFSAHVCANYPRKKKPNAPGD